MKSKQGFNRDLTELFGQEQVTALAAKIRDVAMSELMPLFTKVRRDEKQDGSFVTRADLQVQRKLSTWLAEQWPDIRLNPQEHQTCCWLPREQAAHRVGSYTNRDAILEFVPGGEPAVNKREADR